MLNLREAFPRRLAWLLEQVEKGARVCMISGPQFFMQKRSCEKTGWDSPELLGRIYARALPESLTAEELGAIAQAVLPQASAEDCETIAIGAIAEGEYLASVEQVIKTAKYLAGKAGRIELEAGDINTAIKTVNQSGNLLRQAVEQKDKPRPGRMVRQTAKPLPAPMTSEAVRNRAPAAAMPAPAPQRDSLAEITPG